MIRLLAILLTALAIAGCGGSAEEDIVGSWYDPSDDTTVHFASDGTIRVEDGGSGKISGDYRLLDDSQMSLDLTQGGEETISVVVTYKLDVDTLVLTAPDGDTTKMTRQSR